MLIISSTDNALSGADLDEGADAEAVISMFYIGSFSIALMMAVGEPD